MKTSDCSCADKLVNDIALHVCTSSDIYFNVKLQNVNATRNYYLLT